MCKFKKKICPTCHLPLPNKDQAIACFPRRLHGKPASKDCAYLVDETFTGSQAACWNCADEEEAEARAPPVYTQSWQPKNEATPLPTFLTTPFADMMDVDVPSVEKAPSQVQSDGYIPAGLSWSPEPEAEDVVSMQLPLVSDLSLPPGLSWSPEPEPEDEVSVQLPPPPAMSLPPSVVVLHKKKKKDPVDSLKLYNRSMNWDPMYR